MLDNSMILETIERFFKGGGRKGNHIPSGGRTMTIERSGLEGREKPILEGFERYHKRNARCSVLVPRVSISSTGAIYFNEASVKKFALHEYPYARLHYSKKEAKIGLQPLVKREDDGEYVFSNGLARPNGRVGNPGKQVGAKGFFAHHGIEKVLPLKGQPSLKRNPIGHSIGMVIINL